MRNVDREPKCASTNAQVRGSGDASQLSRQAISEV